MDLDKIRSDFPVLATKVHGKPLTYLDNAASSLKPRSVVDALSRYYLEETANIHRGVHHLSEVSTARYEHCRTLVKDFLGASTEKEIIFTSGATAAINLVANGIGQSCSEGDEIIISQMEHHSNIVPWQLLVERKGCTLKIIPMNKDGDLEIEHLEDMLNPRTKMVALSYVSNALGTVNPIKQVIKTAHDHGVPVLIDAAQAAPHLPINVRDIDCDYLVLSAHKMYGPTGVGVLYGKEALLSELPVFMGGGDMIRSVEFDRTTFAALPARFEAGTPNISGVIGFAAAIEYINKLPLNEAEHYEQELTDFAIKSLEEEVKGFKLIGRPKERVSVISFELEGIHPHDIGSIVDAEGVAIRTGHHCAQPVMKHFGVPATARASLSFYNTRNDIARLVAALQKCVEVFA